MAFDHTRPILISMPQHAAARLMLAGVSFLLVALSLLSIVGPQHVEPDWSVQVCLNLSLFIIAYSVFLVATYRTLYCFGLAYVTSIVLFHLGSIVAIALGIIQADSIALSLLDESSIRLASWYTIYGLGAFGIGYALGFRREKIAVPKQVLRSTLDHEFFYGIGLFLASSVFLALAVQSLGNLLAYSRMDFFQSKDDIRGFGALLMIFPSTLIALVIGANRPLQRIIAYSIGFCGFALLLLSGYRTSALYPLMIGAILWIKTGRRIPAMVALALVVSVIIAIPIVGILRQAGPYNALNKQQLTDAANQSDWRNSFISMGQTNGILAEMLALVPARDPYRYGMTYVDALIDAVPNITMEHSESPRELLSRLNTQPGDDPARQLPLNDWLTYRIAPDQFFSGAGTGSSAIGEAYVNFGIVGVFFVFVLFGFGLARLDGLNLRHRPWLLLLISIGLFHFCRTARDDMANFTKPFAFGLIVVLLWSLVLRALRRTGWFRAWLPQKRSAFHL